MNGIILGLLLVCAFSKCEPKSSIIIFTDLELGKIEAQKKDVDIFILFEWTGRPTKIPEELLKDDDIIECLKNYVVIELMCDDRKSKDGTVADYNCDLQKQITGEYYQPMYCFLDKNGSMLSNPLGYSNKEKLIKYIKSFQEKN